MSTRPPPLSGPGAWRDVLKVAFGAAWIGGQLALVLSADRRPDAIFGFRMFAEMSTIEAHLTRVTATGELSVAGGEWTARDRDGELHRVRWRDRVIEPNLATFDVTMQAAYSASAQVARWRAALDDVAAHTPEDADTRRLILDLAVRRNGHETQAYRFTSPPRAEAR